MPESAANRNISIDHVNVWLRREPSDPQETHARDDFNSTPKRHCCTCKKVFKREMGLTTHIKYKQNARKYECCVCGNKLSSKSNLTQHLRRVHNVLEHKELVSTCFYCRIKIQGWKTFKAHLRTMHPDKQPTRKRGPKLKLSNIPNILLIDLEKEKAPENLESRNSYNEDNSDTETVIIPRKSNTVGENRDNLQTRLRGPQLKLSGIPEIPVVFQGKQEAPENQESRILDNEDNSDTETVILPRKSNTVGKNPDNLQARIHGPQLKISGIPKIHLDDQEDQETLGNQESRNLDNEDNSDTETVIIPRKSNTVGENSRYLQRRKRGSELAGSSKGMAETKSMKYTEKKL